MKIITRKEAKEQGRRRYFTGKPCPRGHVAERYVAAGCVECDSRWRTNNPEKHRERSRRWEAAHPDRVAACEAYRHARKRYPGCVPARFNPNTIPFYAERRRLTRKTGTRYEVDHIHALCLGGKHVASNLQVITGKANAEKAKAEKAEVRSARKPPS